jgi:phosphoglycerol transferase
LADTGEPFNFTMLTADTHFYDGYACELCEEETNTQYSNVIACSDRQVAAFVSWIQEQDFYDNTTIVLVGDHTTMDSSYIAATGAENFDRKVYCTILNAAVEDTNTQKRTFSALDMYPTTLAALGASIEGEHLGLGVNLFSGDPTLCELWDKDALDTELTKDSAYYRKYLVEE